MSFARQMLAATVVNLLSLPSRLASSLVMVVGIAGVVGVLVSVLTMANGFSSTLLASGREDRAIVLRGGANAEVASGLSLDTVGIITAAPGIVRTRDGEAAASIDVVTSIDVPRRSDAALAPLTVRGISRTGFVVRPEIRLLSGRMFSPGVHEVVVGLRAQSQFENIGIGDELTLSGEQWTIVGTFDSGDSHESEFLTDADTLMSANRQNWVNSVTVLLDSPQAFAELESSLTTNPALSVDVLREPDYYERQARDVNALLYFVTYVVTAVMALGAMFAALNTMYSAVSRRTREIAVLRALGFGAGSVTFSVLLEAMGLAAVGGLIGASVAWLFFSGDTISLGAFVGSLVTELEVTPGLVLTGMIWACGVGFLGGLLPAIQSARLPIAVGLGSE